jgi:outer membrane protein assembly factor BamB
MHYTGLYNGQSDRFIRVVSIRLLSLLGRDFLLRLSLLLTLSLLAVGAAATPSEKVLLWTQTLPHTVSLSPPLVDIAIDSANNIYISVDHLGFARNWVEILKYSPNGTLRWQRQYSASPSWEPTSQLVVDSQDNVIITWLTSSDSRVVKLAPNGAQLWSKTLVTSQRANICANVAVDHTNNIYLFCHGNREVRTIKYSKSGTLLWSRSFPTTYVIYALDIAAHTDGSAYVLFNGTQFSTDDITVMK